MINRNRRTERGAQIYGKVHEEDARMEDRINDNKCIGTKGNAAPVRNKRRSGC